MTPFWKGKLEWNLKRLKFIEKNLKMKKKNEEEENELFIYKS